jgi:hypothetical protein
MEYNESVQGSLTDNGKEKQQAFYIKVDNTATITIDVLVIRKKVDLCSKNS